MPLMPDWSNLLIDALNSNESGLAGACHLESDMSGEQFEEALGLLLRWDQVRNLDQRFAGLGGPQAGSVFGEAQKAWANTTRRYGVITTVLNETLYDAFGQQRVDDDRAAAAYGELLRAMGDPEDLVVATTNYDRSVEAALDTLGRNVDTGFPVRPGRVPTLDPAGLVDRFQEVVPVLHLHGAVGWYEVGGTVRDHLADQPFRANLGRPVVLYPDPDKDPTSDATVSLLWAEFQHALDWADHVLVLGHSLNDDALVRALRGTHESKNPSGALFKVAVTHFSDQSRAGIEKKLPFAIPTKADFGPNAEIDMSAVAAFRG
jgi:SIR2-like domain